jgi:geranylgeranyl transferase type-2 subunit alpha
MPAFSDQFHLSFFERLLCLLRLTMHGVRRGAHPTSAVASETEQIARDQASLARRALALRRASDRSPGALATVARAVTANPDEYSLWAFRREALLEKVSLLIGESTCVNEKDVAEATADLSMVSVDSFIALWAEELELALTALRRHPKAYPAWSNRLWLLSDLRLAAVIPEEARQRALRSEFAMSGMLLARDSRNFHGWAHRMRVRDIAPDVAGGKEDEVAFVTDKINADFANYSAWHHRSALLPSIHAGENNEFLKKELEFVRQALYTDPDVQSTWFYHRWLLSGAPASGLNSMNVSTQTWIEELESCEQLLEIEPDARWALHAQADIFERLGRRADAKPVLERLIEIDPMRRGFYHHKIVSLTTSARVNGPSLP